MLSRTAVSFLSATLAATALAACAADTPEEAHGGGGAAGKADGDLTELVFGADGSESQSGDIVAGHTIRIDYDLDRLTSCRGSTNGSEVWGVTGYASFDGNEPVTFGVSNLVSGVVRPVVAELEVPATASSVEMWFAINNRWGCIAYDSNESANYRFAIEPANVGAVLAFESDWSETQHGALHAGDQVLVHYDPARLAQCAASTHGGAAWNITMSYQADGGPIGTLVVGKRSGSELVPADSSFTVPRGHDLAVWFHATSVYGCNQYDSNLSANYHFAIE
jgi:hypothetical protein